MLQEVQDKSFVSGYMVGQLEAQLKYAPPLEFKQWIPSDQVNLLKGLLQKHHYTITGVNTHPDYEDQVLISAVKIAAGTNPGLFPAFLRDDVFMNGWKLGFLSGLLGYKKPEQIEQLISVDNLNLLNQILEENGYTITSQFPHSVNQNLISLTAQKHSLM
jgi:hypothetical protein